MSQLTQMQDLSVHIKNPNQSKAIVLLHGYGADAFDLAPLSSYLDSAGKFSFYFPQGLYSLGHMGMPGRSWFSIDHKALEHSMMTGEPRDYSQKLPQEFNKSFKTLSRWLDLLNESHEQIVIGGFSQGAMMASHLLVKKPYLHRGVLFSGALLNEKGFEDLEETSSLKVFQSHGLQDQVLHVSTGEALRSKLRDLGVKVTWSEFRGGHEIPMEAIDGARSLINS